MERETMCIQAGYSPKNGESRMIPIIQSTTFKYDTSEDMGKLFDLEASGYFYSRLQNPTCDYVAAKICELEGGTAAMLTSSGQAANFLAIFNICSCGDHFVSLASIYGGTFNLFDVTLRKLGIETTFVDTDISEDELQSLVRDDKMSNLERYKHDIIEALNSDIILRYAYRSGVVQHAAATDSSVNRAVELLLDSDEYERILREQHLEMH